MIPELVIENMKSFLIKSRAGDHKRLFPHLLIKTSRSLKIPTTTSICLTFRPSFCAAAEAVVTSMPVVFYHIPTSYIARYLNCRTVACSGKCYSSRLSSALDPFPIFKDGIRYTRLIQILNFDPHAHTQFVDCAETKSKVVPKKTTPGPRCTSI